MNNEPEEWDKPAPQSSSEERPKAWEVEQKPPNLPSNVSRSTGVGFWGGVGYAFLIIVISAVFSGGFSSGIPMLLGAFVALGFAFSRATRMIFVGYFVIAATACLIFVVTCGSMLRGI